MRSLARVSTIPGSNQEPEEVALIAAMRGESRGFDELFRLLSGPLTAFARSRGAEDPDGVANTVLFSAFSSLDKFTGNYANFRAYVYRIARNQLIDEHRKRSRRPGVIELRDSHEPVYNDDFVDQTSDRSEALQLIEHLTDAQREVLLLRTVGGLSIQETSEAVGKSVTATKQLQLRAVRSIQRATTKGGRDE